MRSGLIVTTRTIAVLRKLDCLDLDSLELRLNPGACLLKKSCRIGTCYFSRKWELGANLELHAIKAC
jgi:hypothetical protein